MSFLVRSEVLGLLVSTSATDDEYSRQNRENLSLPIQMHLSKKLKTSCFIAFYWVFKSLLKFEHFEKN